MDDQSKRKRPTYSDEFKRDAVRLVVEQVYSFKAAGLPMIQQTNNTATDSKRSKHSFAGHAVRGLLLIIEVLVGGTLAMSGISGLMVPMEEGGAILA